MSFTAEGWAWEQRCPSSSAKLVLVCLGWFADKDGESAFPSIGTIHKRTQLAVCTVRKALAELLGAKLVEANPRRAGNRSLTTEYCLKIREAPLLDSHPLLDPVVVESAPPPPESSRAPLLDPVGNLSTEPSKKEESPPAPRKPGGRVGESQLVEWFDEFIDAYPRKAGDKGAVFRAYKRALKAAANDPDAILDAIVVAEDEDFRFRPPENGKDFRPYPATWLNGGPWHVPKPKPNGKHPPVTEAAHAS